MKALAAIALLRPKAKKAAPMTRKEVCRESFRDSRRKRQAVVGLKPGNVFMGRGDKIDGNISETEREEIRG